MVFRPYRALAALSIIFETCRSKRSFELNVTSRTVRESTLVTKVATEVGGVRRLITISRLLL